jgi:hypothetical protein
LTLDELRSFKPGPFILSKLDVIDAISDGMAVIAVVTQCQTPVYQDRLAAGWHGSASAELVGPMLQGFGLPIVMTAVLIASSSVQFAVGICMGDAGLAAYNGLGGFYRELTKHRHDHAYFELAGDFAIGACEAAPQIALQGTAIMASGGGLIANPILLLSFTSSAVTGLQRSWSMILRTTSVMGAQAQEDGAIVGLVCCMMGYCLCVIPFLTILIWGVARPFMAESCESRVWGFTTGCAPAATPGSSPLAVLELCGWRVEGLPATLVELGIFILCSGAVLTVIVLSIHGIQRIAVQRHRSSVSPIGSSTTTLQHYSQTSGEYSNANEASEALFDRVN